MLAVSYIPPLDGHSAALPAPADAALKELVSLPPIIDIFLPPSTIMVGLIFHRYSLRPVIAYIALDSAQNWRRHEAGFHR